MDVVSLALLGITLTCIIVALLKAKDPRNLPPIAPGLPIVANLFSLIPKSYQAFVDALSLGDVYRVNIGGFMSFTFLNSFRAVHEAFVKQADTFSGRQKGEFITALVHDAGIVATDGPVWQEHRRLMLRLLRDFGLGRSVVNDLIEEEVTVLADFINKNEDVPIKSQDVFSKMTNNVIARLIFGERTGTDDENFDEFCEHLAGAVELKIINFLAMMFPVIIRYSILRKIFNRFSNLMVHMSFIQGYIRNKIASQEAALRTMDSPISDIDQPSNICEAFLIEKIIQERENPDGHTFTDWQMVMNLMDLFNAGTETTATTLNWTMLLLACNPDVQDRIHMEIDSNIGRQRMPTMSDRQHLPLVCATMDEVMRYSSIVPNNIIHRTTQDTLLLGYEIPANTLIQTNIYGIHHDPKTWEHPDQFYPEHFMTSDGDYCSSKYLIPFSLGKRACLGESLARAEYFITFVTLMQKFKVKLADPNMNVQDVLEGRISFIRHPKPHHIVFSKLSH